MTYYIRYETMPGTGNDHLGGEIEHLASQETGMTPFDTEAAARRAGHAAVAAGLKAFQAHRLARGLKRITTPSVRVVVESAAQILARRGNR